MSNGSQVELPANTRVEYKYVIMEEQVAFLHPATAMTCLAFAGRTGNRLVCCINAGWSSLCVAVLQDWTTQVSEDAEGVVSFQYRTKPDDPPDVQTIQKQMAIVAWQPGPNRIVQVPDVVSRPCPRWAPDTGCHQASTPACAHQGYPTLYEEVSSPSMYATSGWCAEFV